MLLGCGKKLENLEETHINAWRTCDNNPSPEPGTLELYKYFKLQKSAQTEHFRINMIFFTVQACVFELLKHGLNLFNSNEQSNNLITILTH